jgi:DNA adenine methylase
MKGILSYIGGKVRLAPKIVSMIPPHKTYAEVFAGGCQVLFRKSPSKVEVINDLDGELINFYRICQNHHEELLRYLRFMLLSRKWFDLLQDTPPETLTDIQRAGRYFFLQKAAVGGRVTRQNYAIHVVQPPNLSASRISDLITKAHQRLANVQIESLPYEQVLTRFDRPTTFFYLDPPYLGVKLYRYNFEKENFALLAERLRGLQGKFILSLNDRAEIRQLFGKFNIEPVSIAYSVQKTPGKRYGELIIKNF